MVLSAAAASLGAGALSGLGSAIGGITSANKAKSAARDAMQMQMDWEYLRGTHAHQWEVEDLKAAGLNPILSAGGNGATTGGISAAVPDTSGYTQAGQGIASGVASALDAKRVQNETEQKEIAVLRGQAEADNIIADTVNKYSQNGLIQAQTAESMERAGLISKQQATEISKQALNYAETYKKDAERQQTQMQINQQMQRFVEELQILKQQVEAAKANKEYAQANTLQKQYETKHRKFAFWMDQIGKIAGAAKQGTSAAAIAATML